MQTVFYIILYSVCLSYILLYTIGNYQNVREIYVEVWKGADESLELKIIWNIIQTHKYKKNRVGQTGCVQYIPIYYVWDVGTHICGDGVRGV